jgi:hypothetical protein
MKKQNLKADIIISEPISPEDLCGRDASRRVSRVTQTVPQDLSQLEDSLWAAADNLRANSKLTSSEYCMPVLGIIFLRHATNRYDAASRQIAEEQGAGKMPVRPW